MNIATDTLQKYYDEASQRFVVFYLKYAQQNRLNLEAQKEELGNILMALSICEKQSWWEFFFSLTETVRFLLLDLGYWLEYRHCLEAIIAQQQLFINSKNRVPYQHLLGDYASLLLDQGEVERSRLLYEQIIDYASKQKDNEILLFAYFGLGNVYFSSGEADQAQVYWKLATEAGNDIGHSGVGAITDSLLAFSRNETGSQFEVTLGGEFRSEYEINFKRYFEVAFQAQNHYHKQDFDRAKELFLEMAYLANHLEDQEGEALAFFYLGEAARRIDNLEQALNCYRKSEQIVLKTNNHLGISSVYAGIGRVYLLQNRYELARPYLETCVQIERSIGDNKALAENLNLLGYAAANTGDLKYAEICFEQSKSLFSHIDPSQIAKIDDALERLRMVAKSI